LSELRVEVVTVKEIEKHPNADRLELVHIEGWQCISVKGKIKERDEVVYIPIDSILSEKLEEFLFPPESKVKLVKHRVKTIKLRGAISQGLIVTQDELITGGFLKKHYPPGHDLADQLGITKYEPPEQKTLQFQAGKHAPKKKKNPNFHEYSDIQNFKWYPHLFCEGEKVAVLEKIHGTNFRAGYVPTHCNTFLKKIKKLLGLLPEYEFVYGSHRVQLQDKLLYTGFYDNNVYLETVLKYDLPKKLKWGEVIYGEVYGDGIQKGYSYGCEPGEHKLVVFDVKLDGTYLDFFYTYRFCLDRDLPHAPIEYLKFEDVKKFVDKVSTLSEDQKIREGVVIKPFYETMTYMGRKILKWKSDEFLLTQVDDTH
jgi:RNA ligase (TIGR02306 family)